MTQTMKNQRSASAPTASHGLTHRVLWAVAALAVLVIAAVAVWMVMGDDAEPTVTFDGQTAVYDGPATLDAGEVTFTFDASDYPTGVAFTVAEITDPDVTLAVLEAAAEVVPADSPPPPFLGDYEVVLATGDELVVEHSVTLEAGSRYALTANTAPEDTNRVFPAAIIDVE